MKTPGRLTIVVLAALLLPAWVTPAAAGCGCRRKKPRLSAEQRQVRQVLLESLGLVATPEELARRAEQNPGGRPIKPRNTPPRISPSNEPTAPSSKK